MIKVKNLGFKYQGGDIEAIKGVDFHIEKGEIFGLLGPSGAGKTTTQRLIIGLLRGYVGSIVVKGKERKNYDKNFYEDIGVAFDFPNLYLKLTGEENLKLIQSYYKNQDMNLNSLIDLVGLSSDKHKKVQDYSKGMKMRLNFIRALIHNPNILFFDEPTSGLDPVNAKIIKDTIVKLKKEGKTIFLTTHNMTVAEQLCDRVGLMIDGRIEVIDTPSNLMQLHGNKSVTVEYMEGKNRKKAIFKLDTLRENDGLCSIIKNREIKTIHSGEATLEDVFIKLTGRSLL